MRRANKILAFLLATLFMLGTVACNKKGDDSANSGDGTVVTVGGDSTSPEDGYTPPVKDLDGYEFKVLVAEYDYGISNYDVEGVGATVLETRIYERNATIESRLNITIDSEDIGYQKVKSNIETLCGSGTFEYDFFSLQMTAGLPFVIKGYMAADTHMGDTLQLSRIWWDEAATKQLAVSGVNYTYIGDAVIHYFESMWVMAYNHELAKNIQLPNLAELALSGEWTLEVLNQYVDKAYVDTDNSSSKTNGDVFGMTIPNTFVQAILIASGETLLDYDDKNYPSFTAFPQRAIDIFDFIRQKFYQSEKVFIGPRDNAINNGTFHDPFLTGEALFYAEPMGSLQKLKNVDFDFTVIPLPKYDKEDSYLTAIQRYAHSILVPNATPNFEITAIVLENLMYESYKQVRPSYFETVASLQRTRNEDSYRVLNEIVFASEKRVNMALVYDFGGMGDSLMQYAFDNKSLSTLGGSLKRGLNNEIEKVLNGRS